MKILLRDLGAFADTFVQKLPNDLGAEAHSIGLSGELGSGKTTFVQQVARALGVSATVQSPTFTLMRTYAITRPPFTRLVHIDAYRLSEEDTDTFGLKEAVQNPNNLILVEWPENLPGGMPKDMRLLRFKTIDEDTREIIES